MITYAIYAPSHSEPGESSASIDYNTHDEPDFLEIDEQIAAMLMGYC